jgi:putative FmdB family regulatory protein
MPTYEYRCRDCGHTFDVVQAMIDETLTVCPVCGGELRKVFAPPAISFKGSGFYATDHGKKSKSGTEKTGEKPAASTESSDSKSDKKEKKDASKPAEKAGASTSAGSGSGGGSGGSGSGSGSGSSESSGGKKDS